MWLSLNRGFENAGLIGRCKENTIFPPCSRCDLKYLLAGAADIALPFDYFTRKWSENPSCEFQKEFPSGTSFSLLFFSVSHKSANFSNFSSITRAWHVVEKYLRYVVVWEIVCLSCFYKIMQLFSLSLSRNWLWDIFWIKLLYIPSSFMYTILD